LANDFGTGAMLAKLRKLRDLSPYEFGRAMRQETEVEATNCKRETPVETGALRGSIHAEGPFLDGRKITTAVVAGGPAAPYALIVHEDLEAYHKNGEAKFIERPLQESAPHMAERVAKRIDLNKVL
jgi:hypothetical protein